LKSLVHNEILQFAGLTGLFLTKIKFPTKGILLQNIFGFYNYFWSCYHDHVFSILNNWIRMVTQYKKDRQSILSHVTNSNVHYAIWISIVDIWFHWLNFVTISLPDITQKLNFIGLKIVTQIWKTNINIGGKEI